MSGTWETGCESEARSGSHARYYGITLAEDSEATITLESSDADTYLYLREGDATSGTALHENDNHGGSTSVSQIQETLAAGSYTIEATTYDAGETGAFTLTISELKGATGPGSTTECGQTANNPGLVSDCEELLAARDILRGTATLNWSASTPITHWEGIGVTGTPRRVTSVFLANKELTGTIPSELGSLSNLEILSLFQNKLTGTIPAELGSLSKLTELGLFSNQLTGTIPSELGSLSNLEILYLLQNELTGTIPAELGSLSNLRELSLSQQQADGYHSGGTGQPL